MKNKMIGFVAILATLLIFVGVAGIDGTETVTFIELFPWLCVTGVGVAIWTLLAFLFG